MKTKVRVAVVGASGYAGEELVRLLLTHPQAELTPVTSRQFAGKKLCDAFPRFGKFAAAGAIVFGDSEPAQLAREAEIVFLALPRGVSVEFARPLLDAGVRVIDLSADFRLRQPETYQEFYGTAHADPNLLADAVYGLPAM